MSREYKLAAYAAHVSDLRECLRLVTWRGRGGGCVFCGAKKEDGHTEDCEIDAILAIDIEKSWRAESAKC